MPATYTPADGARHSSGTATAMRSRPERSSRALSRFLARVSATTDPTPASSTIISRTSESLTSDRCHLSWKSGSRVVRLSRIRPWVRKAAAVAARAREICMAGIVARRAAACPRSSPETRPEGCSMRDDSPEKRTCGGWTDGTDRPTGAPAHDQGDGGTDTTVGPRTTQAPRGAEARREGPLLVRQQHVAGHAGADRLALRRDG